MRFLMLVAAAVGCAILGAVSVHAFAVTVADFRDPCRQWPASSNSGNSGSVTLVLPPNGPCRHVGGGGETKARVVVKLLLCPGVILLGIALGGVGTIRSKRALTFWGAGLMFLETPVLMFSFWPVSLFTGVAFLALGIIAGHRLTPPISHPAS